VSREVIYVGRVTEGSKGEGEEAANIIAFNYASSSNNQQAQAIPASQIDNPVILYIAIAISLSFRLLSIIVVESVSIETLRALVTAEETEAHALSTERRMYTQ